MKYELLSLKYNTILRVSRNNSNMSEDIIEIGLHPNVLKCNKFSIKNGNISVKQKTQKLKKIYIIYQIIGKHIYATISPHRMIIKKKSDDSFSDGSCLLGNKLLDYTDKNEHINLLNNSKKRFSEIDIIHKEINNQTQKNKLPDFLEKNSMGIDTHVIFSFQNTELSETHVRETILMSHYYYCAIFSSDTLINEILLSYAEKNKIFNNTTKEKILNQILVDFPRMKICYNGIDFATINIFTKTISKYNIYHYNCTENAQYLITMLCTQASFFYSYNLLHNIYSLPDTNIFIVQDNDHPYINIVEEANCLTLCFKKIFKYIDINNKDIPILSFYTYMVISIELQNDIAICHNIKIYWHKNQNIITL